MATTCKLIAKNVLGSDTASVTFSSIPATFDDLILVCSVRSTRVNVTDAALILFNGSSANFSTRRLSGTGTAATSDGSSHDNRIGAATGASTTADTFASIEVYIPNYAGSTNKSLSAISANENNATAGLIELHASLWSQTTAIDEISVDLSIADLVTGSSFFLYGITKS